MTDEEITLLRNLEIVSAEHDRLDRQVEAHFMPQVKACLAQDDVPGAQAIVNNIPDCVARVFMMDAIRQHGRK